MVNFASDSFTTCATSLIFIPFSRAYLMSSARSVGMP